MSQLQLSLGFAHNEAVFTNRVMAFYVCCVSLEVMTSGEEIIILRWDRFDGFPFSKRKSYGDTAFT